MDQATEELLSRFLDRDLDDKEARDFELRLEQEPELQEAFERAGALKGAIAQLAASIEPPPELDALMEPLRRSRPNPRGLRHAYGLLAAAATIVIGVGVAFELQRRHPQPVLEYETHTHVVSKSKKDGYFQLHALPTAVPGEEILLGASEHLLAEPDPESPEASEPPSLVVIGPLTEEEEAVAERGGTAVEGLILKAPSSDFAPDPTPMTARSARPALMLDLSGVSFKAVTSVDGREIHCALSDSAHEGRYTLKLRVQGGFIVECRDVTGTDAELSVGLCSQLIGLRIDAQSDGSVDAEVQVSAE